MLIHMICAMNQADQKALRQFAEDASATFQEYGVTPEELELLRERDIDKIAERVASEVRAILSQVIQGPTTRLLAPWPAPGTRVDSVSPSTVQAGHPVTLTIHGAVLPWNLNPKVTFETAGAAPVLATLLSGSSLTQLVVQATFPPWTGGQSRQYDLRIEVVAGGPWVGKGKAVTVTSAASLKAGP